MPFGVARLHPGSYLSKTLTEENIAAILGRLQERGAQLAPRLFTKVFLERLAFRLRFAAVRADRGKDISSIATKYSGLRRFALDAVDRLLPPRFHRVRVALTFLVLCPFDVLPALWNRLLGCLAVLILLRLQGQGTYPNRPSSSARSD